MWSNREEDGMDGVLGDDESIALTMDYWTKQLSQVI
ncbi:unnamed protein product [Toxocara canis]|uniref:Cytoplasmic protein n=1 Tax=Toxocara canis TaxID=6265 RepID=A0A183U6X2_TOXCA|nr:unnamed protein product [Toxocara canis]